MSEQVAEGGEGIQQQVLVFKGKAFFEAPNDGPHVFSKLLRIERDISYGIYGILQYFCILWMLIEALANGLDDGNGVELFQHLCTVLR